MLLIIDFLCKSRDLINGKVHRGTWSSVNQSEMQAANLDWA